MTALVRLHAGLRERPRPETVARHISAVLGDQLTRREKAVLAQASGASDYPSWMSGWYSSMPEMWEPPATAVDVLDSVATAWQRELPQVDATDPAAVRRLIAGLAAELGGVELVDFKADRLNHPGRQARGLDISRRKYNRRWRALHRLDAKVADMERAQMLHWLTLTGRVGFVPEIPFDQFAADLDAACFVAYFAARKNLRREFTLSGRDNPFDEIAEMLLARCEAKAGADWSVIATIHASDDVLCRLGDEERGVLLGRWSAIMSEAAAILRDLWGQSSYDREGMVVRRGNDSSTWNTVAGAYNTARSSWLSLLSSLDALELLDVSCPGKVMRLMAADLVQWHRGSGGGVDPNTKVWGLLPLPWEVLDGSATCTQETVEVACKAAGLDPALSGWTAPKVHGPAGKFRPTPELVHGVEVADPVWAGLLRRAGVFSRKKIRPELAADAAAGIARGVVVGRLPEHGGV